jgi:hypothetical protein
MKLLIMQFSPASCHFIPLRSKYSPQHLFSNTLSLCSRQNYSSEYSNFSVSVQQTKRRSKEIRV